MLFKDWVFLCFKQEIGIDNEYKVTSLSCLGITIDNQVITYQKRLIAPRQKVQLIRETPQEHVRAHISLSQGRLNWRRCHCR